MLDVIDIYYSIIRNQKLFILQIIHVTIVRGNKKNINISNGFCLE